MSGYTLMNVNGVAMRELDRCTVDGILAAVYAVPGDGKGLIDDGEKRWEYASPSMALAAWFDWLFNDEEGRFAEQ